jgi:hypothetical protein
MRFSLPAQRRYRWPLWGLPGLWVPSGVIIYWLMIPLCPLTRFVRGVATSIWKMLWWTRTAEVKTRIGYMGRILFSAVTPFSAAITDKARPIHKVVSLPGRRSKKGDGRCAKRSFQNYPTAQSSLATSTSCIRYVWLQHHYINPLTYLDRTHDLPHLAPHPRTPPQRHPLAPPLPRPW